MPYPKAYGCCCEGCSTSLFTNGFETKLSKLTFSPDGSGSQWDYTSDWGSINPVFQNNAGYEATPASSLSYEIQESSRSGAMDFKLSFRVYPVFKASTSTFVSKQIGGFIANAFVVWVDFDDRAVYWAPTDATGTIPGSGTLVKDLGFDPAEMLVEVFIFRNEKGTWNLQFHDSATDAVGLNVNWLVEWDKTLAGLDPGPITFGGTTGTGGGGIGSLQLICDSGLICNQCWDGLPQSWAVDATGTGGLIAAFPATFDNAGGCGAIGGSTLDVSQQTVLIAAGTPMQVYPGHIPATSSPIILWFSLKGALWFQGPTLDGKMCIVASVDYMGGFPFARLGTVMVAAWTCPFDTFCCYGANTFTKERLFADGTDFGGPTGARRIYYEQYSDWADEIILTPIGPPSDVPCTQTCVYKAVKNVITNLLEWQLQNGSVNQHVICPGDAPCPEPPMDPQKEGQWVYLPCSD